MAPSCPPGLECLSKVDHIILKQLLEPLEIILGFETQNQYVIFNNQGQKLFYAGEQSDCLGRNCCRHNRAFDMRIVDNSGRLVINLRRPWAFQPCCLPCCLQSLEVFAPPNVKVGMVNENWTLCTPNYTVSDSTGDPIFIIEGPICANSCFYGNANFSVCSASTGVAVGTISKRWSGLLKEIFTDADNFGITFPVDLDVRLKATLLGAAFLIDMMYFEENQPIDISLF